MLDYWTAQGCYDQMIGRLGYRLQLTGAKFDNKTSAWSSLSITNYGFASPLQKYNVQVLLVPSSVVTQSSTPTTAISGYVGNLSSVDIRNWASNTTSTIGQTTFCTSDSSANATAAYEVFLAINDASTTIATNPAFRIVFGTAEAQSGSSWVKSTRINRLMQTVTAITKGTSCTVPLTKKTLSFSNNVLTGF